MIAEYESFDGLGLAELVRRREVSAAEVLETALERVERLNPALNAIVTPLYEEARKTARTDLPDGPFTGVPYVVKELVTSVSGTATTSASRLLEGNIAAADSEMVARLRRAGLVIMGKTNSSEFGLAAATEPALYGPTHNPWREGISPGGSSGGSAAAVAAGILPMGHATDGGGSIRIPTSCCGLFGLKPTRARITAGPEGGEGLAGLASQHAVTWSVRDSAALLDATAGPLPGDPYFPPPPSRTYLEETEREPGRLRIAFSTGAPGGAPVDPECVAATLDTARLCEELGHDVVEAAPEFDVAAARQGFAAVFHANTMANVARATGGGLPAPGLVEPLTRAMAERGRAMPAYLYIRHLQALHRESRHIARFFTNCDLWLTPTLASPPPPIGTFATDTDDADRWMERLLAFIPFTWIANVTGQPAMSVPLGRSRGGLPVGSHFLARYGEEDLLFRLAAQIERARPWQRIGDTATGGPRSAGKTV